MIIYRFPTNLKLSKTHIKFMSTVKWYKLFTSESMFFFQSHLPILQSY